jgi:hypothetical protein
VRPRSPRREGAAHAAEPAAGDEDHPVPRDAAADRRGHGAVVHDGGALHLRRAGQRDQAGPKLRAEAKAAAAEQGVQLTFLPFIVKAAVHALKKFPIVNAELDEAGGGSCSRSATTSGSRRRRIRG